MTEAAKKSAAKRNPSLEKKSAARVAAVQCLYTQSFHDTQASYAKQVDLLKNRLKNNQSEQKLVVGKAVEPNYALVETILEGVTSNNGEINRRMDSILSEQWTRERMSPVLVAILQCAIYELFFGKEINSSIVLDEYSRITRLFFSEGEIDFVYGALSSLIQRYS
jgi:N utilization substance protein B